MTIAFRAAGFAGETWTLVMVSSLNAPSEAPPLSTVVSMKAMLFVVLISGIRPDGSHTCELGFEDQVRQALDNMLAALRSAGAEPSDILKVTAYIVGVDNWPRFNAVYAEVMGAVRPARTVVPVPQLHYGYLVEVDAVAVRASAAEHSS